MLDNTILSSILYGQTNFCCLCFEKIEKDKYHIEDHVVIDGDQSQAISQVIEAVFGSELETTSALGTFCGKCKKSLVNSYKFISKCKDNCMRLSAAVTSLQEAFENTVQDAENYISLFVALDVDKFTSLQYYDNKKLSKVSKAFEQFNSIISEKKIYPIKREISVDKTLQEYTRMCQKLKKENEESTSYDIISVPTISMVLDVDNPTDYTCKMCLERFVEEYELRYHFFSNHYAKEFKCSECPHRSLTEELLRSHEATHKPGVCSLCGKHFSNRAKLLNHELNHKVRIVCQECGRKYCSKESFRKHITDKICQQKSKKNSQDGIYQCDICKKRYWIKPYLAKHIKYEHGDETGYKCKYCGKQFYTPSRLETHMVKHTGEKNFVCSICGGKFVTKSSLIYHTRLHTGEKPYKCDFCESAFLSASRRLDHMRRHHLPPSFKCELCDALFKSTSSFLKHRKRHMNPNSRLNGGPRFLPPDQEECLLSKETTE